MPDKKYVGTRLITPLVMDGSDTTELQNPHIFHNEGRPGLHASSLELEELIDESLSSVHFQTSSTDSASHPSRIGTKRGVSGKESSSFVTFAGDTETVYTGNVGHQGCSTLGGMPDIGNRNHDDTQSALYGQMLDQNSWINNTLEASSLQLGGLRINEPGADAPSDKPRSLDNYFYSTNCIYQKMGNGSDVTVTEKIVPMDNQISGIQPTTQDLQGIYKNYGNSSSHNVGKVQREQSFRHSVEPYSKMTKKARELLKKKQIKEQLEFVDQFHGICPKLIYVPTFSSLQEDDNSTPQSPTWPGK